MRPSSYLPQRGSGGGGGEPPPRKLGCFLRGPSRAQSNPPGRHSQYFDYSTGGSERGTVGAMLVSTADGAPFEDGGDKGRVLVFGHQTGGRYSLMEFVISPRPPVSEGSTPEYGPHRHREIEETFLVRSGKLHFLLGDDVFEMNPGDFVRVPPGTRHGFANISGEEVDLLVSFHPGGFEELFLRHRTDQESLPSPSAFVDDATKLFASEFER